MNILIFLKSRYESFDLKKDLFQTIQKDFPSDEVFFADSTDSAKEKLPWAEIVITWVFPKKWYAQAPKLKAVFTPAAGKDWVQVDPTGKVECHYGSFHGEMIAQSFLGMLLYFNNDYHISALDQRQKKWGATALKPRRLLKDQHLLIVGYGSIGRNCAEVVKALGMKVTGLQRQHTAGTDELGVEYCRQEDLPSVLASVDHILFLLPNAATTANFFTAENFKQLKSTAFLYNFGRGGCIDHQILLNALEEGEIAGAGLDVFATEPLPEDDKLWSMDNVMITPHSSCYFENYLPLFFEEVKGKIRRENLK